jgi:hypothetical protein
MHCGVSGTALLNSKTPWWWMATEKTEEIADNQVCVVQPNSAMPQKGSLTSRA